jgi:hypothetical protein
MTKSKKTVVRRRTEKGNTQIVKRVGNPTPFKGEMYTRTPQLASVAQLMREYGNGELYNDPDIQRRVVWVNPVSSKFLSDLTFGRVGSAVAVADLVTSIRASLKLNDKVGAKKLESVTSQGYTDSCLDGQNRLLNLIKFMKNDLSFTGKMLGDDRMVYEYKDARYKDLDPEVQRQLQTSTLVLVKYYGVPYGDHWKVFLALNSGMPLNAQEKRNSLPTFIAGELRYQAEQRATFWPRITGIEKKISRMYDVEALASLLLHFHPTLPETSRSTTQECLTSFYEKGLNSPTAIDEYDAAILSRFYAIVDMAQDILMNQTIHTKSTLIPYKSYWATMFAAGWMYDNNWTCAGNFTDLYKLIRETDIDLESASRKQQEKDKVTYKSNNPTLAQSAIDEACPDSNYYWKWIPRNQQAALRNKRQEAFLDEFISLAQRDQLLQLPSTTSVLDTYAFPQDENEDDDA